MGRPQGSRNPDFESTRARLLEAVRTRLGKPDGARASFRELASAADVSVATLKHYFGSREELIAAVMAHWHSQGAPYLLAVASGPLPPLRESLTDLLEQIGRGFERGGLEEVHAIGLAAGLRDPAIGPAYLREVLDATLEAVEARLARHVARGELAPLEVRHLALALVSPAVLLLLHQGSLGGRKCRPLAYGPFVKDHVEGFVRGYGRPSKR